MSNIFKRICELRRSLLFVAAGLLVVAIFWPVWRISLGAPQYPEGPLIVEMYLYPALSGDYLEVNALNSYVGFYYPDPVLMDPNFPVHEKSIQTPEWLAGPLVVAALAVLHVFVAVAPSVRKLKLGLKCLFSGTIVVLVGSLIFVQARLYQAGHSLDPDAPLRGVDGFTPPVLGSYEIATIDGFAFLGPGGAAVVAAIALSFVAFLLRDTEVTVVEVPGAVAQKFRAGLERIRAARGGVEVGFLVVALVSAVAIAGLPVVVGGDESGDWEQHFDLDVERSYEEPDVAVDYSKATVGDEQFDEARAALEAADPGDVVVLEGTFDERLVVETDELTVRASAEGAVVDGGGEGRVLTIEGRDVTIEDLWVRNSGPDTGDEDAGVFVDGPGAELVGLYLSDITFGVWVDGVDDVVVADSRIEGRHDVWPLVNRGNGIHLWETDDTVIRNNEITAVRDGIYYSWAENVDAENNAIWKTRYGVHYMYSSDNRLESNLAVDNDVGFALMVSDNLEIVGNTAIRNAGTSGHGILVKDIEDSTIRDNVVNDNANGLYVYNAQSNRIENNLVLRNDVGIHSTAGSSGQHIVANSFIHNDEPVATTTRAVEIWSGDEKGNFWSSARGIDRTGDGVSEIRYRPAGLVEHLVAENPVAGVFVDSPAFDAVRLAESSFPVVQVPGVVDDKPLVEPPHPDWRTYADHR